VAAYYVVAAWLANAAKHARASEVTVCAHMAGDHLRIPVQDDSPLNVGN
jgi:signal transduction histidine kinase